MRRAGYRRGTNINLTYKNRSGEFKVHKRIIEADLSRLDTERASYFSDVASRLEEDARTEPIAHIVFTILKDVMADLPIYLDRAELVDLLLNFSNSHSHQIRKILFDPEFLHDPSSIRSVTRDFTHQVIALTLEKHNTSENNGQPANVHKLTWPYRETDLVDPEDEPEEWAEVLARNEAWCLEHGEDRRRSGAARIDEVAFEKANEKLSEK